MGDNLTYNDMLNNIKNDNIKSLYLFYGQETYLINDIVTRLEQRLINPDFKSMNFIKLDGSNINYESLINACETLPFMDSRKIVLINDCSYFKNKRSESKDDNDENGMEELCTYFGRLPETVVLILVAGEQLDKRRKLYASVKKHGDIVEFKQLSDAETMKWLMEEIKSRGKAISSSDAQYLVSRLNSDLKGLLNEIDKLISYIENRKNITIDDIDTVVPRSVETNIFQLVDMICSKNTSMALTLLDELILDAEPVVMILFMIARQYRLILNTKLLLEKGYSNQEIVSKLGIKTFVLANLIKLSRLYTTKQLIEKLSYCTDTDAAIKKGKMDPRIAVESLIVKFSM